MSDVAKEISEKLDNMHLGDDIDDVLSLARENKIVIVYLDKEGTMIVRGAVHADVKESSFQLSPDGILGSALEGIEEFEKFGQIDTLKQWTLAARQSFFVYKEYHQRGCKLDAQVPCYHFPIVDQREYYGNGLVIDLPAKGMKSPG